jgi:hypothetical protein
MKVNAQRRKYYFALCIFLAGCLAASCTIWNQRQWRELEDRTFQFSKFVYYLKGGDRKTALKFMKNYPTEQILALLEKKYSITVDREAFTTFLAAGNEDPIKVFGMIFPERFTWEIAKPAGNTIELEYQNLFKEETTDVERRYLVTIKTGGKVRMVTGDVVEDAGGVVPDLEKKLAPD